MAATRSEEQDDKLERLIDALDAGATDQILELLSGLHPADIANLLEAIPPDQRARIWTLIEPEEMGEILLEVSEGVRDDLVAAMDSQQLVAAVRKLDTDDVADLLPDLPDEVIAEILFAMDREDRQRLDAVLSFPDDTAGGLMDVDVVKVRANITLEVVLRYLRRRGDMPEYTNQVFVVDRRDRLIGSLLLTTLLSSDVKKRVREVMQRDIITFDALTPDTKVADSFERYNLITAPVVDEEHHLLGRITVDDAVDVIREQADYSVMARAGLREEVDIFAPVAESAKGRAVWLGVNLITAIVASTVIGQFESAIAKVVALAVLMPIVASMGGNAGTQTLTIVIRGMALGTITTANAVKVLWKEVLVGGLNGVIWAVVVALMATLWFHDFALGVIMGVAMIINLIAAALAGVLLPVFFRWIGVDPALASGVALTTVTDVVGYLAFLGFASIFIT